MIASIASATVLGVEGHPVTVEVHVQQGLPQFTLVGLPDAACREAKDRVRAALSSSGFAWPQKRVTVNLAPSTVPKVGSVLDLAIAIGVLVASETLTLHEVDGFGFAGELGLDGTIRPVAGIVPLVDAMNTPAVVVPRQCFGHASALKKHRVCAASSLRDLIDALKGQASWASPSAEALPLAPLDPDLADVQGQPLARWALEVAAAGGHNLLFSGSPGAGKTMLARRLPGLLPDMSDEVALDATKVHSAAGLLKAGQGLLIRPPFRAPHHTSTQTSIVGGGSSVLRPGECSLAHGGVLFLDEMNEFPARTLDALRQPLEEGRIRVARAHATVEFPAQFLCVGALNPCPCGEGFDAARCRCSPGVVARFASRLSEPLRDRFDLRIRVSRPDAESFFTGRKGEATVEVAARVAEAQARALQRAGSLNAALPATLLDRHAPLSRNAERLMLSEMRRGRLTARGLHRTQRVARTLADLDGAAVLDDNHVAAALQLRVDENSLERAS